MDDQGVTMRYVVRNPGALVACALVLFVAACGGSSSEVDDTLAAADLPTLDEYLGLSDIDPAVEKQRVVEEQTRHEEVVAACMAEKGLEYTVFLPPDEDFWEVLWGMSDDEAKLRFGYGFFAAVLEEARFYREHAAELAVGNPNEAIHAQQAGDVDYMAEWQECGELADATAPIDPDPALERALEEAWHPLEPFAEDMWRAMESDPRLAVAEADWSACMAEAGYDFATEEDILEYLSPMLDDLEDAGAFGAGTEGTIPEAEVQMSAEVQALVDVELAIAAADVACRGELDRATDRLQREYESAFIAEHREQLESVREVVRELVRQRLYGREG